MLTKTLKVRYKTCIHLLNLRNEVKSCTDESASWAVHQNKYWTLLHYFITRKAATKNNMLDYFLLCQSFYSPCENIFILSSFCTPCETLLLVTKSMSMLFWLLAVSERQLAINASGLMPSGGCLQGIEAGCEQRSRWTWLHIWGSNGTTSFHWDLYSKILCGLYETALRLQGCFLQREWKETAMLSVHLCRGTVSLKTSD